MEGKIRKKKSPALSLRVTINRKKIQGKNATETFLSAINAIGPERVASLKGMVRLYSHANKKQKESA